MSFFMLFLLPFSGNLFSGLCPKRTKSPVCIIPIFNVNTSIQLIIIFTDQYPLSHHNSVFFAPFPPFYDNRTIYYWYLTRLQLCWCQIWVDWSSMVFRSIRLVVAPPNMGSDKLKTNTNKVFFVLFFWVKPLEPRTGMNNAVFNRSFLALANYKDPADPLPPSIRPRFLHSSNWIISKL